MSLTARLPFVSNTDIKVTQWPDGLFWGSGNTFPPDHINALASGFDFVLDEGTPVLALGDGVVVNSVNVVQDPSSAFKNTADPYGNYVTIKYTGGITPYYATYAHLKHDTALAKDTVVSAGDVVGEVGITGYTTRSHLHIHFGLTTKPPNHTSATSDYDIADANGNSNIVTFGNPNGTRVYSSKYQEYYYTYHTDGLLWSQLDPIGIVLNSGSYTKSDSVGFGRDFATWNTDDYYSFLAPSDGTLSLTVSGLTSTSSLIDDLDVDILDASGNRLS